MLAETSRWMLMVSTGPATWTLEVSDGYSYTRNFSGPAQHQYDESLIYYDAAYMIKQKEGDYWIDSVEGDFSTPAIISNIPLPDLALICYRGAIKSVGGTQKIPVKWARPEDKTVLETSFDIKIAPANSLPGNGGR